MNMIVRNLIAGICVAFSFLLFSCDSGPDYPDQLDIWYKEVALIDANLVGLAHVKDPESGIRMIITKLGTELPGQKYNTVDVDYVGRRYEDKVVFDQGNTKLKLMDYIQGWQIALSKLPVGTEAKVIIPSLYGYGSAGSGSAIPPNTILEFDIKFNDATMSSTEAARFTADTTAIDEYLVTKGIDAVKDSTGLRYVITTPGGGPVATWFSKVSMKYKIKLLTDDSNTLVTLERQPSDTYYSRPVDYIHGMMIGLQRLSIGSKATFYVPSGYAFGADGASDPSSGVSIPANSNIIVEVEILDIQ